MSIELANPTGFEAEGDILSLPSMLPFAIDVPVRQVDRSKSRIAAVAAPLSCLIPPRAVTLT